jgi:hypothetical protein
MLGPVFHTPPPADKKGKKVAWAVAWLALVVGVVMTLLSVLLPPLGLAGRSYPTSATNRNHSQKREVRSCPRGAQGSW